MGRNIPVPAETLRRLSADATQEVTDARLRGHKATARDLQRRVAETLEATQYEDGEFVSIDASTVSSLVGACDPNNEYKAGAKQYLKQYNVW